MDKEYIERDAVINDIGELFTICFETLPNECGHHFIVEKELQAHLDFVRNMPAADVWPVVRGEWVYNSPEDNTPYCSECLIPQDSECNFCPNCGADMRGKLSDIPAINLQKVVRCKECKYRQHDTMFGGSWCNGKRVTDDWFCADGVKKEES